MKTAKQSLLLFLGMALMTTFSFVAYTFLRESKDFVFVKNVPVPLMPLFKWVAVIFQVLIGAALIFLTRGGQIDRAFKIFFPFNFLFFGIYSLLSFFDPSLVENEVAGTIFYLWATAVSVVSLVLILGWGNQQYTFKTAAIQYPILSFLTIPAMMFSTYYIYSLSAEDGSLNMGHVSAMVAILNLLIFAVFLLMNRAYWGDKEFGIHVPWIYWGAIAALVFGLLFGKAFPDGIFRSETKVNFEQFYDYQDAMQFFAEIKGGAVIIAALLALVLGFLLYFIGPRFLWLVGLFLLALIASAGVLVFRNTLFGQTTPENFGTSAFFFAYFSAFASIFMVVVKELAYFAINLKDRFQAKVGVDVIVQALAPGLGTAFGIILSTYPQAKASLYLGAFLAAMALVFMGLLIIRRHLRAGLSNTGTS